MAYRYNITVPPLPTVNVTSIVDLSSVILAGLLATIILLAAHGSHVSRLPQLLAVVVAPFLLRGCGLPSCSPRVATTRP